MVEEAQNKKTPPVDTKEEKPVPGKEKEQVSKKTEVIEAAKKKVQFLDQKVKQSHAQIAEKRETEEEKRAFLIKEYKYESNSNNPPEPGSENERVEEYYIGSESREKSNETIKLLKERHDAEIAQGVYSFDLEKADPETKKALHSEALRSQVDVDKIPDTVKKSALGGLKGPDGKDIDISELTPEQREIVQRHQTNEYLKALSTIPEIDKKDPVKFRAQLEKLAKENLGIIDFADQKKVSLLTESTFIDEAKKNPEVLEGFITSVSEKGIIGSGIDPKSELGKALRQIGEKNVRDFFTMTGGDNIKDMAPMFGGLYMDMLGDSDFSLDDKLQKSRQTILSVIRSGEFGDTSDPKELESVIKEATGLEKKDLASVAHSVSGGREKMHPFLQFLMDILAPLGVMLEENGLLEGDTFHRYMQEKNGKNAGVDSGDNEFSNVDMMGTTTGAEFVATASTYIGKPYEWGKEFENGGGGDCSGLVVRTLRDKGCMGSARPTAAEFRSMSHKVGDRDGQVGDFLIRESGSGATHIEIIEKNNGDGTYDTIEAKGKAYGTIRSRYVRAGGNLGVYKNPFLTENAQYAGKMSKGGRGKEGGYASNFKEGQDYVPNPQEIAGVNVDLGPIQSWEGTDFLINYPGSAESGFTIGHGYDLRFYSPATIERDWGKYMTPEILQVMKEASGKHYSSEGARHIQEKLNNLPGGFAEFKNRVNTHKVDVLRDSTLPRFIAETKQIYPQIVNLEPKAQTALVSLVYNRGSGDLGSPKRIEMREIQAHLSQFSNFKGREKEFYRRLADLFVKMNSTRGDWPAGLKRRRMEEASLVRECGGFVDPTLAENQPSGTGNKTQREIPTPQQNGSEYFKNNTTKQYGSGDNKVDCMTSVDAALNLGYGSKYARGFQNSHIEVDGKKQDLWNVAMVSAIYSGLSISPSGSDIKEGSDGYYGSQNAQNPNNIEYHIEENIMKRTEGGKKIEVPGVPGILVHYGAGYDRLGIVSDIDSKLDEGESAIMGGTGEGTNKGGHEWLVVKEQGELKVYESTKTNSSDWRGEVNGINGKGYALIDYLRNRQQIHSGEAIIFAKKNKGTPKMSYKPPGDNADKKVTNSELRKLNGMFVGDSLTAAMYGNEDDNIAKAEYQYGKYYKIGASSKTILGYVESAVRLHPPFISILAGTNDVDNNVDPLPNIQKMIDVCRTKGVKVFLGTLPSIPAKQEKVDAINARIRQLKGPGVEIVDYASLGKIVSNGLHPGSSGYAQMRQLAYQTIQRGMQS